MLIRVVSDLHLEFLVDRDWKGSLAPLVTTAQPGEILCICGDFASYKHILFEGLQHLARAFDHVVFVCGNHEFYGKDSARQIILHRLRKLEKIQKNFHFLENAVAEINGQRFVGTTLWFPYDPMNQLYEQGMNDFWSIADFHQWIYPVAAEAHKFLEDNLQPHDVVLTHHLPTHGLVQGEYKTSKLNRFFVHDCEKLIHAFLPKLWLFGHTHTSVDQMIGDTRCVANPRGYPHEHFNGRYQNHEFAIDKQIAI